MYSDSPERSADIIGLIYERCKKNKAIYNYHNNIFYPLQGRTTHQRKIDMLTCIEGIGRETAKALFNKFGSIQDIACQNNHKKLREVNKVGFKKAKKILEIFR